MNKSVTFTIVAALLICAGCVWAFVNAHSTSQIPSRMGMEPPATATAPAGLRLGIIPERDVFEQRKAYHMLSDYLASKGVGGNRNGRVDLLTASSYAGALSDFQEGQVDAAFVGSLVAVLAHDRCGADVLLKSEMRDEMDTYAGVVFVRDDSPARKFDDLMGKRIGGVKTTTAGAVYPLFLIRELGWAAAEVPALTWVGTHDDVLAEVVAGRLDAGAVKDSRFDAYVAAHPDVKLRQLGSSGRVPNNALIVRKDMPAAQREKLVTVLLVMNQDPAAAGVLKALGLKRFVRTDIKEYAPLYDMIEAIGPGWFAMDVGPAPKRPAELARAEGGE